MFSTLLKFFEKHIFFQSFSRSAQPRKASSREISNTTLPFLIQPMLETPLTMFQRMSWQNTDALLTLRIEDQATVSFLKSYNEIQCFFQLGKIKSQTCNLKTGQSLSYKYVNQFFVELFPSKQQKVIEYPKLDDNFNIRHQLEHFEYDRNRSQYKRSLK